MRAAATQRRLVGNCDSLRNGQDGEHIGGFGAGHVVEHVRGIDGPHALEVPGDRGPIVRK